MEKAAESVGSRKKKKKKKLSGTINTYTTLYYSCNYSSKCK